MIPWYVFAFLTAIFSGIVFILQKKILKYDHSLEFSAETAVIVFLMSLAFLPFANLSAVTLTSCGWMYLISIIGAAGFLLISKSIRHSKLSSVVPLVNIGPLFTALVAFLILGEGLTFMQIGGIGLLIVGAYVLELNPKAKGMFEPFKKVLGSKYRILLLLGILCYSFSSTIERFVLTTKLDPLTAIILIHFFLALNYLIYEAVQGRGVSTLVSNVKNHKWLFILIALLMLAHRTMGYYAVQLTTAVALVVAIKRMGSFVATLFGGTLFHEDGVWRKSLACLILIAGAVIIVVF